MQNKKRLWLPALIIGAFTIFLYLIVSITPSPKREHQAAPAKLSVETQVLQAQTYAVQLNSFGRIQPGIQSTLVAQVSGQIIWLSDKVREGGSFHKNDVLLRIDDRDYQVQRDIAKAELATANASLEEEISKSEQARREWQSAQLAIPVNDFALRKPQLAAAKAAAQSATAKLNQAELNLQRTAIRAPYNGKAKTLNVDLGDVVSTNTSIANIYATDYAEIRLPVKNSEIALLDTTKTTNDMHIDIRSTLAGNTITWPARVSRVSASMDDNTQQIHLIARIENPFSNEQRPALIPGQYAEADINSGELHTVIVIPNKSIYQGSYVYLVRDQALQKTNIQLRWQDATHSIIAAGLQAGDELVLTPLGQVNSGTPVLVTHKTEAAQ